MKLDSRIKELIAVGASVTANCQPCMEFHVGAALQGGADEEEVMQAIAVAKAVRKGAASKFDKFAASIGEASASNVVVSEEGCGCS